LSARDWITRNGIRSYIGLSYDRMNDNKILIDHRYQLCTTSRQTGLQSVVDEPEKLGVYGKLSASGRAMVVPKPATVVTSFMRLLLFPFRRRRCAEARLLQSTLENIGEGLSVFDSRGRLIAWNSSFLRTARIATEPPGRCAATRHPDAPSGAWRLRSRRPFSRGRQPSRVVLSRRTDNKGARDSPGTHLADQPPLNAGRGDCLGILGCN
jgi:PAS domain-containing protein